MQAGKLSKTIVLQRRDSAKDTLGEQVTTWSDVAQLRAEIVPLSAREMLAAQAVRSEMTHQITVRFAKFLADPKEMARLRIVYGTRLFNIQGVINVDESDRQLTLLVSEGLNDG